MKKKCAVILYNLGSPNKSVFFFLFNLFNDKNIINLPQPFRFILATTISILRLQKARSIYAQIKEALQVESPLLPITLKQKEALLSLLKGKYANREYRVFVAMRYSKPRVKEVIDELASFAPDYVIHLPLYPQFSTTTTYSSFQEYQKYGLSTKNIYRCCFFETPKFIAAHVEKIKETLALVREGEPRLLFSAHSLPKSIIDKGDPYQSHIERTAKSIVEGLNCNIEWDIAYQSKVGKMEWLSPDTEGYIKDFAALKRPIIIVPIAFVSENSETVYELDIEYQELIDSDLYFRVPTLDLNRQFIELLADLSDYEYQEKHKCCDANYKKCWRNL